MKIMTVGNGFIASHLPYDKITARLGNCAFNICNMLEDEKPDVLVNCIGFCGVPNIDQCEIEKEKTLNANTVVPILLAQACNNMGIHMVHIASGCIYCGKSPNYIPYEFSASGKSEDYKPYTMDPGWKETDIANPASYYAQTKYACDLAIAPYDNVSTLRIRMPISPKPSPRGLIAKLRGYKSVIDIPNSMTMVSDLVRCIDWVIQGRKTGIYNVVNPEPITAAQIMQEYQKHVSSHQFEIISGEQLDQITKAKRSNCILDGSKLKNAGFTMTPSQQALEECMKVYIKNCNIGV
jgi:dTDP-4-dehydrorhamnose reductase